MILDAHPLNGRSYEELWTKPVAQSVQAVVKPVDSQFPLPVAGARG